MKPEYEYLNDEELKDFMDEVEKNGMIAPPVYLKELIMKAALGEPLEAGKKEESDVSKNKNSPTTINAKGKTMTESEMRKAKRQFLIYSMKITAAAAAAVFCLITMPVDFGNIGMEESSRIEKQIAEDTKQYQQEKRKALKEDTGRERKSLIEEKTGIRIWNGLTNWLWNGGEEL